MYIYLYKYLYVLTVIYITKGYTVPQNSYGEIGETDALKEPMNIVMIGPNIPL